MKHSWNWFQYECSPEGTSSRPENVFTEKILLSSCWVNVLRQVISDTRRTFMELVAVSMFSGG